MDPDKALENLREAIQRARAAREVQEYCDAASDAMDAAQTLDEWLSIGGFLPVEWQQVREGN